ncbi:MAG: phospholipid/cholesterol/gamma-HCH transport system ATP-binding protein [Candidatus Omnitrophota bacterium]|jgi:phospholipid/cholesterol/gamma-HCH transport system ATP-binding protein
MIEITNLHKSFFGIDVLKGIDLTIPTGEFMVIIGLSGCGKSLLLKHLIGLEFADQGQVKIAGLELLNQNKRLKDVRQHVSILFQNGALFDSLTVLDNVTFGLIETRLLKEPAARKQALESLSLVGLEANIDSYPYELSGGMRKRVAMARAIAVKPKYILYDEPTSGLDPVTTNSMNQLMVQLSQTLKITSIAVTHDMQSAQAIATRMAFLNDGRMAWQGVPSEALKSNCEPLKHFIQGIQEPIKK